MEVAIKGRRPLRFQFDRLDAELEEYFAEVPVDWEMLNAKFQVLSATYTKIMEMDQLVLEKMIDEPMTEADEDKEYTDQNYYGFRAELIRQKMEKFRPKVSVPPASEGSTLGVDSTPLQRKVKLPQVELMQFDGDLMKFLPFWAQFKKIDQDPTICGSDKFWYLLQSLKPGTDAHEIASSYPQTDENYPKAVEAIQKRFGNKDVLLQVYIRELLKLVIANASTKDKIPLKTLHFKLESHLRALRSLELEKADPNSWLFPLVESSLPEEVLYNWQRNALPMMNTDSEGKDEPTKSRLDYLMSFIEREVEIKQRVEITKSFTDKNHNQERERKTITQKDRHHDRRQIPTLSGFHSGNVRKCVFCDKTNHDSKACFKAKNMSFEDKKSILKRKGLCFRCMGNHLARNCGGNQLHCLTCGGKHCTILCNKDSGLDESGPSKKTRKTDEGKDIVSSGMANVVCSNDIALQTIIVNLWHNGKCKTVRAFIDSGSQGSYVLRSTVKELGLDEIDREIVVHSLFGGQTTDRIVHGKYEIELESLIGDFNCKMIVRDQNRICHDLPRLAINSVVNERLKGKGVRLTDIGHGSPVIEVLIGADVYGSLLTGKIEHLDSGAVAIETRLGWTLIGPVSNNNSKDLLDSECTNMAVVDSCILKLWDLELLGIRDPFEVRTAAQEEFRARESFKENITRKADGRYVVKLPWKEYHPFLPNNKDVAIRRLEATARQLVKAGLFETYDRLLKNWEEEGFIETVPNDQRTDGGHYIPHRAVIKESVTTPVRPVFDASCRVGKSPSLNMCLEKGGNYIQLIPDNLIRFREKKIGFVSDLRKAFQMIEVTEEDRHFMKFLWYKNDNMNEIIEYRHCRVMFGANCSPFILGVVLDFHLSHLPQPKAEIGRQLLESLYVDNCLYSANSHEYHAFRNDAITVMREAQMDLRMWYSSIEDFDNPSDLVISVLGLNWDRLKDELYVKVPKKEPLKVTKRSILSIAHQIFDPIGFVAPTILPLKILLQKTWKQKKKWDQELSEEEAKEFRKWFNNLPSLENVRIPRMISGGVIDRSCWSLHTFTDAGKNAYGAVVYLRTELADNVSVQLLAAKSRLSPMKPMTITRLELMGCLVGARLAASTKEALKMKGIREFYHSDSAVALAWIKREDHWSVFVGNRSRGIRDLTSPEKWRHVPGTENPADIVSRGCTASQLVSSRWWEGPEWLYASESEWPKSMEVADEKEIAKEVKKTPEKDFVLNVSALSVVVQRVKNHHTFTQMVRIVGWVRRYLHNRFATHEDLKRKGDLSVDEIATAELAFIRNIQRESFIEIGKALKGLEVFEDDQGVLRIKTRLTNLADDFSFKYPALLPGRAPEVKQLIRDYHEKFCHAGTGILMVKLRSKFWILKARQAIKGVINRCTRCRRFSAKGTVTEPAPLPLDRIKQCEVFEVTGVDLAGPLFLKNGKKVWMVIFTCAVYRAVHFELIDSLSTGAFVKMLGRFIRKYRRPTTIYSDNGTNFRGTNNLFRSFDWDTIQKDVTISPINWKFIPPTSAWWGGWWERLIRTAKDLLKRTVGKSTLTKIELERIVTAVGDAMNDRPLTYVSEDPNDLEPLTPSHFLHLYGPVLFPEGEETEAAKMRYRYKYVQTLKKELQGRFRREYLSQLIQRSRSKSTRNLRVGDLVFIGSDGKKRLDWNLGRIIRLIPGKDGIERVAVVKTKDGELTRSVQRLFPMEVENEEESNGLKEKSTRSGRRVKTPRRYE